MKSLAFIVGTGKCNAKCSHCAGKIHRKNAPEKDGIITDELFRKTIRETWEAGAEYLSLSSSGEPTLSPIAVTKTLEVVAELAGDGFEFNPINLYSNGIKIGEDEAFCKQYLPLWKTLGLTHIYVTVHNIDNAKNAKGYGIKKYPPLELICSRIHGAGLFMRANVVLTKKNISTIDKFIDTVEYLRGIGADAVSAWPVRTMDDDLNTKLAPCEKELDEMEAWAKGSNDFTVRVLRSRKVYQVGDKLTLFQNGILSNTWCC